MYNLYIFQNVQFKYLLHIVAKVDKVTIDVVVEGTIVGRKV